MKKKLLSLALALVMCLSLTIPAQAAPPTMDEALGKIEWTGSLSDNTGFSPRDFDISGEIHLSPIDDITTDTLPKYTVTTADEVFTVKHLGKTDDGSYVTVWGYAYTLGEDGTYTPDEGINGELHMIKNRSLILWEEQLEEDDHVQLHAGQSATFKLPTKNGYGEPVDLKKTLFNVKVGIYIPEIDGGYLSESFFKIDPDAVSKVLNRPKATGTAFTDVYANSPYLEAINWAVDKGITKGKTATTFGPNDHCTIRQILTFLYRSETKTSSNDPAAVKAWAQSKGISVTEMDVPCDRSSAVNYMWKAAGNPAPKTTASFKDVPAGADYARAMSWAVEKGITKGTTATTFGPNDFCTRGQIVTFLYRASK